MQIRDALDYGIDSREGVPGLLVKLVILPDVPVDLCELHNFACGLHKPLCPGGGVTGIEIPQCFKKSPVVL